MAGKSLAACASALTLSVLTGCGTLVNATGARMPFGGVAADGVLAEYGAGTTCGLREKEPELPGPPGSLLLGFLALLDLPFSAAADVLTLPAVLHAKYVNQHESDAPQESCQTASPAASKIAPTTAPQPPSP